VSQKPQNSKAASSPKNLTEKQIRRIWTELKPQPLLDRLRAVAPGGKWTASGSRVSGCCPFHDETGPSFHIYLDRGYAKCFGCEKFTSNPIDLWAGIKQISRNDALTDLRNLFGLKFLSATANTMLEAWERHQLLKKRISQICHDTLVNAVANPTDPVYRFAQGTVTYLLQTRALPKDALPSLPMLGILPPLAQIYDALDQDAARENAARANAAAPGERVTKVTSLTSDAQAYLLSINPSWIGAIMFRLDLAPDVIGRLKVRRPDTKEMMMIKSEADESDDIGFFGLGWPLYRSLLGAQQKYVKGAYHVEGEFDALSIMARQVLAGGPGFVVVSGGGSGGSMQIDTLHQFGFEEVYLVGDAPHKKGNQLIGAWLPLTHKLRTRIFIGYSEFPGSGDPDEAVAQHELTRVQEVLLDTDNPNRFALPQDWCFEQVAPVLDALPAGDVAQQLAAASDWGRKLNNPAECDAFLTRCAEAYGIAPYLLKRAITAAADDEPGYIMRIVDVLSSQFAVVGQRATDSDRKLYLWYKAGKRIIQVRLADDTSLEHELGTTLGPTYQVFREKIGVPAFLEPSDLKKNKLQEQDKAFRWFLRQAILHMAYDAPDFNSAPHKGQGIHVERDPLGGPPTVYLVNGVDVYIGTFDQHNTMQWKLSEGPTHNGVVFDVGVHAPAQPFLPWIQKPADLDRATTLDPKALHQTLHRILDIGWTFKNHGLTVDFLAAHLLGVTVSDAFRRKVFLGIHADTSSGKSRLMMGLIAGADFPRIHLIAAAQGMSNFTAAGIRQMTHNSARPLCLDEFENEGLGNKKDKTITEVFEMYRSLVGENNTYTMGQRGGDAVTYTLNYPVFIAAINKAKKVQDANRTITVHMQRVPNRLDPVEILLQEYGADTLESLKKDLSIALLPHIATLQQTYREIEVEYGRSTKYHMDRRYFEGLFPALTMMRFLGLDYHQFLDDFYEANKEAFRFGAGYTDSIELFHNICHSPWIPAGGTDGEPRALVPLTQLLATQEERAKINSSNSGLYFDESSRILIVNWMTAQQVVLRHHTKYGQETNLWNLREMANRAPNAVPQDMLQSSGVLSRLRSYGIGAIPLVYLTGYYMADTIDTLGSDPITDQVPEAAPAATQAPPKDTVPHDNADFGD
jgi:hypothetical protein